MHYPKAVAASLLLVCCLTASAKDKKKFLLPNDVLEARTLLVVIDPKAGTAVDAPLANQTAREDVEQALTKWGRFELVDDLSIADLVISVRKANGKIAQPTIGGIPDNNRPVIFQPNESGGRVGVSHGTPPMATGPSGSQYPDPSPQIEAGPTQDMFAVFRGRRDDPTDSPAVWRYEAKGALRSPGVPAVDEFKKLITEAETQRANNP